MDKYNNPLYRAYGKVIDVIAACQWTNVKAKLTGGPGYDLLPDDLSKIKAMLSKDYYIILTRRKTHLTTYTIGLASLLKTGEFSSWSHALMNLEGDNPTDDTDFRLEEATGAGVHYSDFMQVFNCDWVALLKPRNIDLDVWTSKLDALLESELGKPYDDLFDLSDSTHMSCVELVRSALQGLPDYDQKFANFEKMIVKEGNLTPQLYYDCPDFEVAFEVRR